MSLIWQRAAPQRRRRVELDRERIVVAAVALADTEGLPAVTLRRVAADLEVLPMRLYTYLRTKDDLLDLMLDAVYATVELPAEGQWRPTLTAIAHGIRDAATRHPWFVTLLGSRPPYGPNGLRLVERVWSTLSEREPDAATAAAGASAFIGYVTGALAGAHGAPEHEDVQHYLAQAVAEGPYPALAKAFAQPLPQDTFTVGLQVVLDGIAAQLTTHRRTAGSGP